MTDFCSGCNHPIPSWCSKCQREFGCGQLSEECKTCGEKILIEGAELSYPLEPIATGNKNEVIGPKYEESEEEL